MEQNINGSIYQLYTIVSDSGALLVPQQNFQYEAAEEDNQFVYVALQKDEVEEEQTEDLYEIEDTGTDDPLQLPADVSGMKLITLDDGQLYLTTDAVNDTSLTIVQPELLSSLKEETSLNLLSTDDDELDESTDNNFQEIQLEDGTCAIINTEFLQSLIKSAPEEDIGKKKKFPCKYAGCGKAFTTGHHLSVHIRSHTGSRPYACTIENCDKAFATGYSLKTHLRIHTGEKPYACNICMKKFKTSGDLQKHVRTHTGEKPFKCPIDGCDKSFTTSNIRKVHIRSHTGERPYVCKLAECGKAFASATNYKNHMRIHSGEKPYVCSIESCGKRFTEYSSLYKHNAVHLPYRNFQCNICCQYFKYDGTLKLHKKIVHNIYVADNGTEYTIAGADMIFEICDPPDLKPVVDPLLLSSDSINYLEN